MNRETSSIQRREFVSQIITGGVASGIVGSLPGCGTLLHRERAYQPHSRDLDWKIVALDGLGLILFFIPGVIAFAVDFHSGAIYMPSPAMSMMAPQTDGPELANRSPDVDSQHNEDQVVMKKIAISTDDINVSKIERAVSDHVGSPITLSESSSRVTELEKLDDFTRVRQLHEADKSFGLNPKRFFESWMSRRTKP